jgi:hypothetical protein
MKSSVLRVAVLLLAGWQAVSGYSVLTHEAIIDTVWDTSLKPVLLKRYPDLTPEQLREAHAYAYGGAIIQDMGYYPFGSKFFSDLAHYVRSGDFIEALLRDSQDSYEYAFALGALAHYASDNEGHSIAVNRAVPLLYPKLARKYGKTVTYEDDPAAHLRTEFGFDVVQVANGKYAPEAYHDFIGFSVSKPLLERAFEDTYSVKLKDVFKSLDLTLGTYRHTVSSILPEMTKAAWAAKKNEIVKLQPGVTRKKFIYNLNHASYVKDWGQPYEKPGVGARFLAFLFRLVPKIGPFKALAFRPPTPEAEKLFIASFDRTLDRYRSLLAEVSEDRLKLSNTNFDTGEPSREGTYRMADQSYSELLEKLAETKATVSAELRDDILAFYREPSEIKSVKAREEFEALRGNSASQAAPRP